MKKYKPYLNRVDLVKNQVEREKLAEQEASNKRKRSIQQQNKQRWLKYQEQLRSELAARYFHAVQSTGGDSVFNKYSLALDGTDDFVTFGNMSNFSGATQFTFSGWYNFNSVPARESIFSILVDNNNFFDILMYDALTYVQLKIGGVSQLIRFNSNLFTQGQWSHIVVAYDNTQSTNRTKLKVYIDNVDIYYGVITAITSALPTGTNVVTIGETSRLSGVFLNGNADECAVFNTQLSASDVSSIYNSGVPNDISSLSPLSWWRFEEGSGTTATDSGTGGNDGSIDGATYSTDVPS